VIQDLFSNCIIQVCVPLRPAKELKTSVSSVGNSIRIVKINSSTIPNSNNLQNNGRLLLVDEIFSRDIAYKRHTSSKTPSLSFSSTSNRASQWPTCSSPQNGRHSYVSYMTLPTVTIDDWMLWLSHKCKCKVVPVPN
jgi:hypothetical protein